MTGMFLFKGMYKEHIKNSRLKMPEDFDNYDPEEFPHFHVFMGSHIGFPIDIYNLEHNANIIADIPEDEIKTITFEGLEKLGIVSSTGNLV